MAEVETKLKISAIDTSGVAFKQVAQQIEQMTQRVTKSQRVLVESHKNAAMGMAETAATGFTTLERLAGKVGIALGVSEVVKGVKESVKVFASLDQQARALSVATGSSLDKVHEFYERLDKTAAEAKVPVEELRHAFDLLARRFTAEGAQAMLPGIAQAAAGMHANAEQVATFNTQIIKTLGLTQKDAPAAFDSLIAAARGGGIQAAELADGVSTVARDMDNLGMKGPKALYEVEAAMESLAEVTKDSQGAIMGVQAVVDAVNTKKMDKAFLSAGINIKHELEKGAKAGQSALEVIVEQGHKAAVKIQKRNPALSLEQSYSQLTKSPEIRQTLQDLYASKDVTAEVQKRIAGSHGAMAEAAKTMTEGMSGDFETLSNVTIEAKEAVGSFADHVWQGAQAVSDFTSRMVGGQAGLPPATQSPTGGATLDVPKKGRTWGDFFSQFNPISSAGAAEAPGGGFPAIRGARPLVPSEPGSATERTAREQLEATRRLERASLFGGAGGAIGGGGVSGGLSPPTGGGGGSPGASAGGPSGGTSPRALGGGGGGGRETPGKGGGGGGSPMAAGSTEHGKKRAAQWMHFLQTDPDLKLTKEQAAGIVGNLSHESGGFTQYEEGGTAGTNRGGRGDAQWTGPRRRQFEAFAQQHGVDPHSFEAQSGFMKHELLGSEAKSLASVRKTSTVESAATVFEQTNERAGVVAMGSRLRRAKGAYEAADKPPAVAAAPAAPSAAAAPSQAHPPMGPFKPEQHSKVENMRVKVAYDFDAADVRTHSRAYARRSFNKEARNSRYSSYTDMGTVA